MSSCPFCLTTLQVYRDSCFTNHYCNADACVVDDMPRYQRKYDQAETKLIGETFMLDKYYVQVDYLNDATVISELQACLLLGTVQVPRALLVDFSNVDDLVSKIKTLLLFT